MVQVIGTGFSNIKRERDSSGSISGVISVYFEGIEVTGIFVDDTSISVTVPPGIPSGTICIKYEGKDYCSPVPFTVIASNPTPNSYMHLGHHPGANNNVAVSVQAGNNIYAGFINWWKYTIQQDIWTVSPAPTDKVSRAANFTINGKGYLFGGMLTTGSHSNRLQVFDEASNFWSFAAPLPGNGRSDAIAFVWNNKAYVASGTDNDAPGMNTISQQLWEYDPSTNTWTRKADLLYGIAQGSMGLKIGNYFYLPGSGSQAQEYNPATNSWRTLNGNYSYRNGYTISDKNFDFAYAITDGVTRVSLNNDRSALIYEFYNYIPAGGYAGAAHLSHGVYQVYANEVYFGLGRIDPNIATQTSMWWRYRY